MNKRVRSLAFATLLTGVLGACDDVPTAAGLRESSDLTVSSDLELQVVGDAEIAEVMLEDMSMSVNASPDGAPFIQGRMCLRAARQMMLEGAPDGARVQARECRLALVQELIRARGEQSLDELFARAEGLVERVGEAEGEFARAAQVRTRLQTLLREAYELRADGDAEGAGERLVLALQIADRMRHRHPDFDRDPAQVVRLAIARAGEAIHLAGTLITAPTVRQEALLFRAGELRQRALFAAELGWYRRAVALALRAEEASLVAVFDAERPTVSEAEQLLALAEELIRQAELAIGDTPTEDQRRLLDLALRLKDRGAEAIDTWNWRGVGLLWHSAVTSSLLIPGLPFA